MVKRYAMMTVLSLIYISPKAQVSPNRQSRAIAPITHDLLRDREREKETEKKGSLIHTEKKTRTTHATSISGHPLRRRKAFARDLCEKRSS